MKIIGIIPARYASSRFPGKPLALIHGKTMVQRVYEQATKASLLSKIIVATDDERVYTAVKAFKGEVIMTSSHHQSGTERCHEALQLTAGDYDAVINIQGDEPYIDPAQINQLCIMLQKPDVQIVTLCKSISMDQAQDPNTVKVVTTQTGKALYFSRSQIPFVRNDSSNPATVKNLLLKHIGIYGYRAVILSQIVKLKPTTLELAESLEQLRWLDQGYEIFVELTDKESFSIDTPNDIEKLMNIS